MARPSSIDRLEPELREMIGELRGQGCTIDEILAKLRELKVGVSRSALGRHVQQIDAIGATIKQSRAAAEAIMQSLGEAPENRTQRLNIELMHSLIMTLMVGEQGKVANLDPQEAMFAATAIQKLAQAAKQDVEREARIRKDFAKKLDEVEAEAAKAGEKGLSAERIAQLRKEFLGVGG